VIAPLIELIGATRETSKQHFALAVRRLPRDLRRGIHHWLRSFRVDGVPVRASATAFGRLVIAFGVATGLGFSCAAHADAPTLADRVAALVPRFGSKSVELVDPQEFGAAVDSACKGDRECAVRLVTMAIMESGLSKAVSLSEYKPHQGDAYLDRNGVRAHRAWGTWQGHKNARNADVWGSDDLLVQARSARSMQLGALAECRKFRGVTPEVGMWRVLSGRGCMLQYSGEDARQTMLARIRRAL
jgi:hypothetical protein